MLRKLNSPASKINPHSDADDGNVLEYRGPIRLAKPSGPKSALRTHKTTIFVSRTSLATNGSGVVTGALLSSAVTGASEWAQYQVLYNEYRVLGMEVLFTPVYKVNQSGTGAFTAPVINYAPVRSNVAAPSASTQVLTNESCVTKSGHDSHKMLVRMSGSEEAIWFDTASTFSSTSAYGVFWFGDLGTASSGTFMYADLRMLVEFRLRS